MYYYIVTLVNKPEVYAVPITDLSEYDEHVYFTELKDKRRNMSEPYNITIDPVITSVVFPTIPDSLVKIANPYYERYNNSLLNVVYSIYDFARFTVKSLKEVI